MHDTIDLNSVCYFMLPHGTFLLLRMKVQCANETKSIITKLIHEFTMPIREDKEVYLLSTMNKSFFELASENGVQV